MPRTGAYVRHTALGCVRRGALLADCRHRNLLAMQSDRGRQPLSPTIERCRLDDSPYSAGPHRWSNAYRAVLEQAERFARDRTATILIEGESGTGKTLLGRRVHDMSPRRQAPFRRCVLSALDDSLAADELFGHVPGAFTGARDGRAGLFLSAAGGTLFLDEIGKASLQVQQKLLHAIEYGEIRPLGADRDVPIDVRIIAAANIPLPRLVKDGKFLPDLYARLKAFVLVLPPLRDRAEDVPHLVRQCIVRHAPACGYTTLPTVDERLMKALTEAPWPDNLRELDGVIHRLLVEADGDLVLNLGHASGGIVPIADGRPRRKTPELQDVLAALEQTKNNKAAAAKLLGTSRQQLYRILPESERAD
jgi:DNA-binding NtrC family response regulator